uniref:Uncharacterized protein n=1 Tax=Leersia perrieri TaxID=77586 RepID=A0A0D9XYV3_9ORYZ
MVNPRRPFRHALRIQATIRVDAARANQHLPRRRRRLNVATALLPLPISRGSWNAGGPRAPAGLSSADLALHSGDQGRRHRHRLLSTGLPTASTAAPPPFPLSAGLPATESTADTAAGLPTANTAAAAALSPLRRPPSNREHGRCHRYPFPLRQPPRNGADVSGSSRCGGMTAAAAWGDDKAPSNDKAPLLLAPTGDGGGLAEPNGSSSAALRGVWGRKLQV